MGCRTNGLSNQWVVGPMGCRTNGLSDHREVTEHNNKRQVSRPMIYGRNHNKNISIVNFSCVFVANDFLHSFYLACNVSCSLLASIRHEFEWHVLHRFIVWLSGLTAAVHEGSHKDRKFKFRLGRVTENTQ